MTDAPQWVKEQGLEKSWKSEQEKTGQREDTHHDWNVAMEEEIEERRKAQRTEEPAETPQPQPRRASRRPTQRTI